LRDFGWLHGAVNCADAASAEKVFGREGPHSLESFEKVVEVNLVGSFKVVRIAAAMVENEPTQGGERRVIVNTASVAAFDGQIGQVAYAPPRAASLP
jgi:NAD(P)-dependent dehydrogenase (short-subunit alcohol dehydrogenase family)